MHKLLTLWTGPLPPQELHPDRPVNPLVHWVFHPLKRHIARLYLMLLQRYFGLKVIAITGSAGKTTTKDMLTSILKWLGPTIATFSNITPTYNIPSTILKCNRSTRFLILEMGIEYPGDMDFYTWLATPDIAIITSVNLTHTAYLGSLSQVATEKGKILKNAELAVVNSDDKNITIPDTQAQINSFGSHDTDFCQILTSQITEEFKTEISLKIRNLKLKINLPLLGLHFASNAAAAATAASLLDAKPQQIIHGLQTFSPPLHRMQVHKLKNGSIIIDDTYNANPLAVKSSLDTLSSLSQISNLSPLFVFGQMNELGKYEKESHKQIGSIVKNLKLKIKSLELFCYGPATKLTIESADFGKYFESKDDLLTAIQTMVNDKGHILILLKASHSHHFEDLVNSLIS